MKGDALAGAGPSSTNGFFKSGGTFCFDHIARWRHPFGLIEPTFAIPIAEFAFGLPRHHIPT